MALIMDRNAFALMILLRVFSPATCVSTHMTITHCTECVTSSTSGHASELSPGSAMSSDIDISTSVAQYIIYGFTVFSLFFILLLFVVILREGQRRFDINMISHTIAKDTNVNEGSNVNVNLTNLKSNDPQYETTIDIKNAMKAASSATPAAKPLQEDNKKTTDPMKDTLVFEPIKTQNRVDNDQVLSEEVVAKNTRSVSFDTDNDVIIDVTNACSYNRQQSISIHDVDEVF